MFEPLNCIALRTVKYNDRHSILTAYSRQHGRVAMLMPAGSTRAAMRLRALSMPLGRFDCVAEFKPGRDILPVRDVRSAGGTSGASPLKAAISLFVADLLASLLREPQQDELLYDFISFTVERLVEASVVETANFHICFMMRLQHFLGIEPDWSTFGDARVFDMADGIFRSTPPLHGRFLPSAEAEVAYRLRRMNFRTARLFRFSRVERNMILDRLIQYYRIHFPGLGSISSLAVLRSLFDF